LILLYKTAIIHFGIETAFCRVEYDRYRLSILFDLIETGIIMKRVSFLLVIVLLFTACSPSESSEQTPNLSFLAEFFTVNKDERLDTYLDALSQGEDPQVAKDAYYAGIAPFVTESVLSEMQDADYLYLLDKSCTDLSAKWRLSSYGMVPLSSEEEVLHYKYQVSLSYPGFVVRHHITLTGYYDLDQEQKVTAFSKVTASFVVQLVHSELRCYDSDHAAGLHFVD